jgi:hypothetical protein
MVLQIHELSEDDCLLAIITKAGLGNQSLMTDRQLMPISAGRHWPLYGDEYSRMKFSKGQSTILFITN